jgi:hypothetical protein
MSTGRAALTARIVEQDGTEEMVAVRGSRPMMAWLHTDLPEPDSPTSAKVPPGGRVKRDMVRRRAACLRGLRSRRQVLDAQQIFHTFSS